MFIFHQKDFVLYIQKILIHQYQYQVSDINNIISIFLFLIIIIIIIFFLAFVGPYSFFCNTLSPGSNTQIIEDTITNWKEYSSLSKINSDIDNIPQTVSLSLQSKLFYFPSQVGLKYVPPSKFKSNFFTQSYSKGQLFQFFDSLSSFYSPNESLYSQLKPNTALFPDNDIQLITLQSDDSSPISTNDSSPKNMKPPTSTPEIISSPTPNLKSPPIVNSPKPTPSPGISNFTPISTPTQPKEVIDISSSGTPNSTQTINNNSSTKKNDNLTQVGKDDWELVDTDGGIDFNSWFSSLEGGGREEVCIIIINF